MLDPNDLGSQHSLCFLLRLVEQQAVAQHTGCVDDPIQMPILLYHPLDEGMDPWPIAHVHLPVVDAYARAVTSRSPYVKKCRSTKEDDGCLLHLPGNCLYKEPGQTSCSSTDEIASALFPRGT